MRWNSLRRSRLPSSTRTTKASTPPDAACGSSPRPSRRRAFASSPASATRMRSGWSKSSTTSRAGSSRSTAPRTGENAVADPGGGAGGQAPAQRPPADLPVRRRAHRRDGSGERAQARQRLHAPVRGLAGVPRPRHRPRGAALPRAPAAADVQGADGLHAARQLFLAHARAMAAASPSARARSGNCSTSSSARTRCAPTFRCRSASSARCSITPGRSPRASATRRASSAPTRRSSSSAAPRPPTRSSGTAWSARGDLVLCDRNCHKSILHSLIMTGATPIYLVPSRNGLGIIGPISARAVHAGIDRRKKIAASPFAKETERQGSPDGDDQLDL